MAVGPIPTTAILAYAELMELDRGETFELLEVVRGVDNGYLGVINSKRNRSSK